MAAMLGHTATVMPDPVSVKTRKTPGIAVVHFAMEFRKQTIYPTAETTLL
jgi:hypothetical protein